MKRAVLGPSPALSMAFTVAVSVVLFGLTFVLEATAVANAAPRTIVVEQFRGRGAEKVRDAVKNIVGRARGFSVVGDKQLVATESNLGLMQASDAYGAVAKELGVDAFLSARVRGRGRRMSANFVVRDASGKPIGKPSYRGRGMRGLLSNINDELPRDLARILGRSDDGPPAAAESEAPAQAQAEPEDEDEEVAAPQEEADDDSESLIAADDAAEASVSASIDDEEPPAMEGPAWKGLQVSAGVFMYQRDFEYNELVSSSQGRCFTDPPAAGCQSQYSGPAPAAIVGIDYFFLPYLGVTGGGEFTFLTTAEQEQGGDIETYDVASMAFWAGVSGKYHMGALQVGGSGLFGQRSFEVTDAENVAPVTYTEAKLLANVRYDIGPVGVFLNGGYIHVLDMGDFLLEASDVDDLDEPEYFPGATASGAEATLGVAVGILEGLEARASATFRQYGIAMNSLESDRHIAGGATDRYTGIQIGVAYRPGF